MRRIDIDFLRPPAASSRPARRLRASLWLSGLALIAWEAHTTRQLLAEQAALMAITADANVVAAGPRPEASAPPATLPGTASAFDRRLLDGTEQAFGQFRRSASEVRLDSWHFDASRRMLILRGEAAQTGEVDRLAEALHTAFPLAGAVLPDLRRTGERTQFEIGLRIAAEAPQ